ncbi:hypothetical protein KSP39_PZI014839 [Platanthera zijinensis]|uniref:Uncharacterized protein n=1 Tax=Platanthera zijinensis TaxID=2320716 RepID=A0AAP0BBE5_9ASPA
MSWENEDDCLSPRSLVGCVAPDSDQKNWKPRVMYSRDFLLSLSESDVCKKLPTDLDKSVLSDLEQAANTVSERQRSAGNLALQGPRRGEHGFQPLNSYARGSSARWDTRSSGSNDREGDSQFDRESFTQAIRADAEHLDVGGEGNEVQMCGFADESFRKKVWNQNQRSRPHQEEHDGLLGSGALAKSQDMPEHCLEEAGAICFARSGSCVFEACGTICASYPLRFVSACLLEKSENVRAVAGEERTERLLAKSVGALAGRERTEWSLVKRVHNALAD